MANLHIIPTDKPSRLVYFGTSKGLSLNKETVTFRAFERSPQNNYITNSEEIKDCWVLNTHTNQVYFLKGFYGIQPVIKKIILTTDQDLIKDGVQAIDDNFLEWFVKNPSCDKVEIKKTFNESVWDLKEKNDKLEYKIIIPKEEPKQETLEEAAEKYNSQFTEQNEFAIEDFNNGAKWQQQNRYSEEDMILYSDYVADCRLLYIFPILNPKQWFEQFKKK